MLWGLTGMCCGVWPQKGWEVTHGRLATVWKPSVFSSFLTVVKPRQSDHLWPETSQPDFAEPGLECGQSRHGGRAGGCHYSNKGFHTGCQLTVPFFLCTPVVNPSPRGADVPEQALTVRETEEGRQGPGVEQSNGLGKPTRELNGSASARGDWPLPGQEEERGSRPSARGPLADGKGPPVCAQQPDRTLPEKRAAQGTAGGDLDFDLSSDSESDVQSSSDGESGEKRSLERPQGAQGAGKVVQRGGPPGPGGERPCGEPAPGLHPDMQEEGERDGLCGLGGGSADRKEAETESQNSEQSGVTAGESLDQSVEEDDEDEDDGDGDDHLVHLEDILARVHSDYYARYDRHLLGDSPEAPDIRKIVPELKSRVLADVAIIFSGLHPTNFPIERTREHYHATALGAKVLTQLALDPGSPNRATHLIAARAGRCPRPAPPTILRAAGRTQKTPVALPGRGPSTLAAPEGRSCVSAELSEASSRIVASSVSAAGCVWVSWAVCVSTGVGRVCAVPVP